MTQTLLTVLSCVKWMRYCDDMTQRKIGWTPPSAVVARRIKELRQKKGWSAAKLADACGSIGMPELNRSVIANIESRRRKNVTLEEAMTLAMVLDVAPLHLIVPTDVAAKYDSELFMVADATMNLTDARAWITGGKPLTLQDPRVYYSEVPRESFEPSRPSDEEIAQESADVQFVRELLAKTGFTDLTDGDDNGIDTEAE